MAESIGYSLAAFGPVSIGFVFDVSGSWTAPLIVLVIISVLGILFGFGAGKNRYVLK